MSYHLYNVVFGLILDTYCMHAVLAPPATPNAFSHSIFLSCLSPFGRACVLRSSALPGLILYPPGFISKLIYVYHKCVPKCVVILLLPLVLLREQKHFKYAKKKPHTHAHHAQLAITQKHLLHSRPRKQLQLAWRGGTGVSGARKPGLGNCAQLVEACSGRRNSSNGCNR